MTNADKRLIPYLQEIANQAQSFIICSEMVQSGFEEMEAADVNTNAKIFTGMQGMLSASAAISKLFHPPQKKALHKERARFLAEALPRTANDRILASREVRNAFEHFEEHLDEFIDAAGGSVYIYDRNISNIPLEQQISIDGMTPKALRAIRIDTGELSMLDRSVDTNLLARSVIDAALEAQQYLEEKFEIPRTFEIVIDPDTSIPPAN